MKRIWLYLFPLALLSALALYFALGRRSGTYAPTRNEFSVTDTGRIASVEISTADADVTLYRKEGAWLVNGYPVKKGSVPALYTLLSKLEPGPPVSKALQERIREGLQGRSTLVRILMNDRQEKAYRVYYDSLSAYTFMLLEGSDLPFRVSIRGYRQKNLQELFSPHSGYWRDNLMLHCLPGDIRQIFLQNNPEPEKSFHVLRDGDGNFNVSRGILPESWIPASQEIVNQYLAYFYDVRFEKFLNPETDTLFHSDEPDYELSVELADRHSIRVELYPVSRRNYASGEFEPDYNRLYAHLVTGDEWVVVKYVQIDPLLKDFEYFADLKK